MALSKDEHVGVTIIPLWPSTFNLWGHLEAKEYAVKLHNAEQLQERTVTAC
jgi:hypothetical protein